MSEEQKGEGEHQRLTFAEIESLNKKQDELRAKNLKFVRDHPELKQIISDFTAACLFHKPDDVYRFAFQHFKLFAKGEMAEMLKQKEVYKAAHEVEGHNMMIVIEESYDRTRWMTVRAQDRVTGESRVAEFSEAEVCGRLGVTPDEVPEKVAQLISYRLATQGTIGMMIGDEGISPSVAECSAALRIQSVQRGKEGRRVAARRLLERNSARSLQTRYRGMRDRAVVKQMRLERHSSTRIQAQFRGRRSRIQLLKRLEADAADLEFGEGA
jgi:hypothetical protein